LPNANANANTHTNTPPDPNSDANTYANSYANTDANTNSRPGLHSDANRPGCYFFRRNKYSCKRWYGERKFSWHRRTDDKRFLLLWHI
jgi:hypothetical protein